MKALHYPDDHFSDDCIAHSAFKTRVPLFEGMERKFCPIYQAAFRSQQILPKPELDEPRAKPGFGTALGENDLEFLQTEKLFLIMTTAGKPVFSSHGDIQTLAPIIATLYAMISKVETIENPRVQDMQLAKEPAKIDFEELDRLFL